MKADLKKLQQAGNIKDFPDIKLGEGEHVVLAMYRTKLGLLGIWLAAIILTIILSTVLVVANNNPTIINILNKFGSEANKFLVLIIVLIYIVIALAAIVSHVVYTGNKMFVTNKRAIQLIRTSLFSGSTNVIELHHIEDVSFKQNGIFDTIFNIGTLRMSTVGDETTYTFPLLDTPYDEVDTVSTLISEAKICKQAKQK